MSADCVREILFRGNRGPSVTWNDAICSILAAPIIIPAEGGETDGTQDKSIVCDRVTYDGGTRHLLRIERLRQEGWQ